MTTNLFVHESHSSSEGRFNVRLTGTGVDEEFASGGATYVVSVPAGQKYLHPKTVDGFMFATLMEAMRIGEPFHIHGAVSSKALKNAALFSEAWHDLKPDSYKPVRITADSILSDRDAKSDGGRWPFSSRNTTADDSAVSLFSGGVDALFTALRHSHKELGEGSHKLSAALMVHLADADSEDGFLKLKRRVAPVLESMRLDCFTVRTDLRRFTKQDWEMSFAAQLAGCLHLLSGMYQYGLVGSSEPYSHLILPWGSSPATDYLLSGAAMEIVHDGAAYTRTQKIKRVASDPVATRAAKFCWRGPTDKNCGVCEKCIRTRFNFLAAADLTWPECFEQEFDLSLVPDLELSNLAIYTEFRTVLEYAENQNRSGPWLDALRDLVGRHAQRYMVAAVS